MEQDAKSKKDQGFMKLLLSVLGIAFFSFAAHADYTIQHAYNIQNLQSITGADGAKIVSFTGSELGKDSRGNISKGMCLATVKGQILSVDCEATDQDGDSVYSSLYRDMSKGPNGVRTVLGGTGKYANAREVCNYVVDLIDVQLGIAVLSGECK